MLKDKLGKELHIHDVVIAANGNKVCTCTVIKFYNKYVILRVPGVTMGFSRKHDQVMKV